MDTKPTYVLPLSVEDACVATRGCPVSTSPVPTNKYVETETMETITIIIRSYALFQINRSVHFFCKFNFVFSFPFIFIHFHNLTLSNALPSTTQINHTTQINQSMRLSIRKIEKWWRPAKSNRIECVVQPRCKDSEQSRSFPARKQFPLLSSYINNSEQRSLLEDKFDQPKTF